MTAEHWFGILQGILILVIGWLGRLIGLVLREVRAINGRIVRLEEFRKGHEAWSGERHTRNDREHGELHAEIRDTRQSVEALRQEAFKLSPKTPE